MESTSPSKFWKSKFCLLEHVAKIEYFAVTMATEAPVEWVDHNYMAKHLFEWMDAIDNDYVDIQLTERSKEKTRVLTLLGDWRDILFQRDLGESIKSEIERLGYFEDLYQYHYFIVGPVSKFEADDWSDCVLYVDGPTLSILDRRGIVSGYRKMPDKVYDLAFAEAKRLSWEM